MKKKIDMKSLTNGSYSGNRSNQSYSGSAAFRYDYVRYVLQ